MPPTPDLLLDPTGTSPSLVLLEYNLGATCVLALRQIVQDALSGGAHVIFVSLMLSPHKYLDTTNSPSLHLCDLSGFVPGYSEEIPNILAELEKKLQSVERSTVLVVIDSPDTLLSDLGSQSQTMDILSQAFGRMAQRSSLSRLVLQIKSNSPLLSPLLSTNFQPRTPRIGTTQPPPPHTLTHLIFHPTILFTHLAQQYHISLPPPNTPPDAASARFWSVFTPVAKRGTGEQLVMGVDSDQFNIASGLNTSASRNSHMGVVEMITRARAGGQKGVRRVLRGWQMNTIKSRVVWCLWEDIPDLKPCITASTEGVGSTSQPMDSVSFNLQLSEAQQQARANVPLPYTNAGIQAYASSQDGEIHYVPDQADDFDDDDPDDDLYI